MVPHSKGVMRINPKTGDRFRWKDVREDGFIFDHYDYTVVRKNGYIKEHWRDLKSFKIRFDNQSNFSNKVSTWLDNKKLHKGCQHCGYKTHAVGLAWHHIDPSTKEGDISSMKKNTLTRFKKIVFEIWKCIVLCATCHNVEHQRLRKLDDKN
tara:strand:+ start:31 stop:486 length:456 start_codon:yes stop_codon:yes gene_type:complete